MDKLFDLKDIQKIINACVNEMYPLEKGIFIDSPDQELFQLGDARLTRKQAKHIIEQRKAEGKSAEEVRQVFYRVLEVVSDFDFETLNPNQTHPGSTLRIRFFKGRREGIVVVMDAEEAGRRNVITAYQCKLIYAYSSLLKKLNATAAGKTPGP